MLSWALCWELGKDFLQLALQEQEAESRHNSSVGQKPKVQVQSPVAALVCWVQPGGLLSPWSFRRSRLGGSWYYRNQPGGEEAQGRPRHSASPCQEGAARWGSGSAPREQRQDKRTQPEAVPGEV